MEHLTGFAGSALWGTLTVSILALLYAIYLIRTVWGVEVETPLVSRVGSAIRKGANSYLRTQFRAIAALIAILTIFLYASAALAKAELAISIGRAAAFLMGSIFSATVGYVGMNIATRANERVAELAVKSKDLPPQRAYRAPFDLAYNGGIVTGAVCEGLGLLGGTIIIMIYGISAPEVLLGFGFGGTLIALFMRVGGGIYTKAADVGADLVGKVEKDIPEDDPRNAAVIADLVGDNVGDCAGMAADIFESYEVTIVSALILGLALSALNNGDLKWIIFPIIARAVGIVASIIANYTFPLWRRLRGEEIFYRVFEVASLISASTLAVLVFATGWDWRMWGSVALGITIGPLTNWATGYFTSKKRMPVQRITSSAETGTATVILTGISFGFLAAPAITLIVIGAIILSVLIWHGMPVTYILYGVALTGIGQLNHGLTNLGMDAFGPISDNAQGIGEMAKLEEKARNVLTDLDAVGNTTKAITKGMAIGSAVIAAVSLFGAFSETAHLEGINVANPTVFIGALIGASVPFLFSSISIGAVSRAAGYIIEEVRRQFHLPGVLEGITEPDYAKTVEICTEAAQRELVGLGLIGVLTPVTVGVALGAEALGGFLVGVIISGQLLAIFMANTGGAWDNAKKIIEDEEPDTARNMGKGSERHKATVIGDTVGDPLKDTAGPALNPMIKVINMVSLLLAPVLLTLTQTTVTLPITLVSILIILWVIKNSLRA